MWAKSRPEEVETYVNVSAIDINANDWNERLIWM